MFKTIVWATDGSATADDALPYVTELARSLGATIVAVHATEILPGRFGGVPALADDTELVAKVERQVEQLRSDGYTAELRVVRGIESVAGLVARAAEEVGASLIVVGTHGHGALVTALVGSVTRGLLHTAGCPVMAVPPAHVREPALA